MKFVQHLKKMIFYQLKIKVIKQNTIKQSQNSILQKIKVMIQIWIKTFKKIMIKIKIILIIY